MARSMEFRRAVTLEQPYDLIVCGGGPAGVPAALAARRAGLSVLLIEAMGQLGGVGTSAGVSHLLGGRLWDNSGWCVGGIFREVVETLAARGGAINPADIRADDWNPHGWSTKVSPLSYGVPFDPIAMVAHLDELLLEAGVDVLFFSQVVDVEVADGRITHVVVQNKSGLRAFPARAVVDATGDGDIAARSGCEVVKGRPEDGAMTPVSLIFHVDRVDQEALKGYIQANDSRRLRELIADLRARGAWDFPYEIFISVQLNEPGTMMINTTRICGVDGTDARSLSRGMMQGRREVQRLFALMRAHFPGFADSRVKLVAPNLGVRETRRIVGDFVYTVADLLDARDFPDTIGFSSWVWDLPDPRRPSHQPMHAAATSLKRTLTPIPYRVLVPRPIANLICPGRMISVERDVLGPLREMAPCYAMGQAAGQAAVQTVRDGCAFAAIDVGRLRDELRAAGAIVDIAMPATAAG
ncbi:MAG TPA: FAD-dependent oxidoreductase [Planctomycetota bacterium]|nr:FAD-dependent oxidoreductase [Planctomycetota bacterium]